MPARTGGAALTCCGARLGLMRLRPYCVVVEAVLARGSVVVSPSTSRNGLLLLMKRWLHPGLQRIRCCMHNPQIWALLAHTISAVSQRFVRPAHASLWVLGACGPSTKNKTGLSFAHCCFKLRAAVQGARLVEDMHGAASGGMEPLPASVREWATAAALTHMRFGTNLETQQHLGPARPSFHALSCRFVRESMSCVSKSK